MSENTTEVLVGGVVLAVAIGFVAYAGQITGFQGGGSGYDLHASFRSGEGITVGTDVRLAGVKVGTVTDMALNPETYRADTTISIGSDIVIPDDSQIAITSEGLLGGNFVEILPGGSPMALEDGGEFYDTQSSVSLVTLLMRYVGGQGGQ